MPAKPAILVTVPRGPVRESFFPQEIRRRLERLGEVSWNELGRQFEPAELAEHLRGVSVCMTGWGTPRLDESVMRDARSLVLLAHTAGSVASFVSDHLYDRGVRVVSGNRVFAESVAESVLAYALLALRRLPHWTREVQEGRWSTIDGTTEGLLDQSVGLVGFGAVARFLVPLLRPFRVRIRACDPRVEAVPRSRVPGPAPAASARASGPPGAPLRAVLLPIPGVMDAQATPRSPRTPGMDTAA